MAVSESNAQFARYCGRLRDRFQLATKAAFLALIAFLNDRLLPTNRPLDGEAILAWCQAFLDKYDAGENQYRGVPVDPEFAAAMDRPAGIETIAFRGRKVAVKPKSRPAYLLAASLRQPFVPRYQRSLRQLIFQAEMTDMDALAATPEMEPSFRGREL